MGLFGNLIKIVPLTPFNYFMCYNPIYFNVDRSSLLSDLFAPEQRFISIPCGKCDECRVSRSREWSIKCMCEFLSRSPKQRVDCWFITLTYDDEHNPFILQKRDLQLFFKRLRKRFNTCKIKYFAVGEYGSKTYRPHYHFLIYGLPIPDLHILKFNKFDDILYTSETINKVWGNGHIVIGDLTLKSAAYTARYCLKKSGTTDVFQLVSKGFGKEYFLENMDDIISNGCVSLMSDGRIIKCSIPKYFLKLYRKYVGDTEYIKFLLHQNKKHSQYVKSLDKVFRDRSARFKSTWVKCREREIGKIPYSVAISARNRKIINQSLMDLYKFRDFSV